MRQALRVLGLVISLGALPLLSGVTGCATGSGYERNTGESVADRGISARVYDALGRDTQYKYGDVTVSTRNGTVELRGQVHTLDQKNRAEELVGRLDGVREVVNNISVRS